MLNDNRNSPLVERLLIAGIITLVVWAIVLCGIIVYNIHKHSLLDNVGTQLHVPTFQRGDCFVFDEEQEVWNNTPDGVVERVGKNKYLILFREAAEKRGGSKYASTMPITTFDLFHRKTPCPETWVKHTHAK